MAYFVRIGSLEFWTAAPLGEEEPSSFCARKFHNSLLEGHSDES